MVVSAIYHTLPHLVITKLILIASFSVGHYKDLKDLENENTCQLQKGFFFLLFGVKFRKSYLPKGRSEWKTMHACLGIILPKSPTPPFDGWPELFVDVFADVASPSTTHVKLKLFLVLETWTMTKPFCLFLLHFLVMLFGCDQIIGFKC